MLNRSSEICAEIELPRSSLHNVDCSYPFPSPPASKNAEGSRVRDRGTAFTPSSTTIESPAGSCRRTQQSGELHENSWFYYLSEISLLRLSSRVNHAFYTEGPASWTGLNLLDMITCACDFESQLQQWQGVLPPAISCFDATLDLAAVTELQLATWSRCASIRLHLYRPFLYRLANCQDQDWMLNSHLREFAEKAVSLSLNPLFTLGLRHRHAMTWYKCRETAVRALMILCAKNIGLVESMGVEDQAKAMVQICIEHLRYWESEADDLKLARELLEHIYSSAFDRE